MRMLKSIVAFVLLFLLTLVFGVIACVAYACVCVAGWCHWQRENDRPKRGMTIVGWYEGTKR